MVLLDQFKKKGMVKHDQLSQTVCAAYVAEYQGI